MADYYEILGVTKNASDQEIKTAYRKQALKWHPDRNKESGAADKFKEINKAYEVLSNPQKKQMYDQYGESAFKGGAGGAPGGAGGYYSQEGPFRVYTNFGGEGNPFENMDFGGFSDPFEIFEQFFGFQSPFGGRGRGKRREIYQMSLTFEEAVHGTEKQTVIKGDTKTIKIPAGVNDGTTIRFTDFDLQVIVKPHKYFRRENQDIYLEKEISYPTAVLGGTVEVETIKDPVTLKVRPGTESGATVRLRGQGVPYPNSQRVGDQYVVFKIKVPERVSHKTKKLLEELKEVL